MFLAVQLSAVLTPFMWESVIIVSPARLLTGTNKWNHPCTDLPALVTSKIKKRYKLTSPISTVCILSTVPSDPYCELPLTMFRPHLKFKGVYIYGTYHMSIHPGKGIPPLLLFVKILIFPGCIFLFLFYFALWSFSWSSSRVYRQRMLFKECKRQILDFEWYKFNLNLTLMIFVPVFS